MQSRSKSQYGLIWALSDRFQPQINRIEIRTHICRLSPIVVIQCGILRSNAGIACQRYFQKRDEMNGNSCSEQNRCNLTRNELILPAIQDVECHTVVIILTTQSASSTMWSSLCRSKSSEWDRVSTRVKLRPFRGCSFQDRHPNHLLRRRNGCNFFSEPGWSFGMASKAWMRSIGTVRARILVSRSLSETTRKDFLHSLLAPRIIQQIRILRFRTDCLKWFSDEIVFYKEQVSVAPKYFPE